MKELKFKTNINCSGCIAKFTPFIEDAAGVDKWEVDTANAAKILTIQGDITESKAIELVQQAGFKVLETIS